MLTARWFRIGWIFFGMLVFLEIAKQAATFALGPTQICMDAIQYTEFGKSVASGDFLLFGHYVSYRMPGYGWFLGPFFLFLDRYALLGAIVAQHAIVLLTSLIPAWVCYRVTGRRAAFLAAYAIAAVGVSRAWFANVLLTDTLFTFCLALLWWALYEYTRKPSTRGAILIGIALSLATLVRPVPQLLSLPIFFTIGLVAWERRKEGVRLSKPILHCAMVACVLIVFLAPWSARNWTMFGEPFIAKLPAVNKWVVCFQEGSSANLPLASDDEATRELISRLQAVNYDLTDRYCYSVVGALEKSGMSEHEIHTMLNRVCLAAIAEHPMQFAVSMFKRSVNIWRCQRNEFPHFGAGEPPNHGDQFTWRSETIASFYEPVLRNAFSRSLRLNEAALLCVALGCWWLLRDAKTRSFGVALTLSFLYFSSVTAAVEIENYRYRMILEPAMIIAVVGGFSTRLLRSQQAALPSATERVGTDWHTTSARRIQVHAGSAAGSPHSRPRAPVSESLHESESLDEAESLV